MVNLKLFSSNFDSLFNFDDRQKEQYCRVKGVEWKQATILILFFRAYTKIIKLKK